MLIVAPPGYVLTSGNEFVCGGPVLWALGAGLRPTSDGCLVSDGPRFAPEVFPQPPPPPPGAARAASQPQKELTP